MYKEKLIQRSPDFFPNSIFVSVIVKSHILLNFEPPWTLATPFLGWIVKSDHTVFLMRSFKYVTVWNLFLVPCGVFFTFLIKCDFEVKADTAFNPALLLPLAACVTGSNLSWCFCPGVSGSEQALLAQIHPLHPTRNT